MLKKIKSLFIIEDDGQPREATRTKPGEPGTNAGAAKGNLPFVTPVGKAGEGKIEDKFLEVLFQALESSNQEGFDYMEFKEFLKSLANVPMDDQTRYKSAFATAQTMGATKEVILSSARHYISILANEQKKFQEALAGQKEKNLTNKQEEIRRQEQTIRDKEEQIQKLTSEIQAHRDSIGQLEVEINEASEKLSQTANDFEATYQALLGQIQVDVQNIESHL